MFVSSYLGIPRDTVRQGYYKYSVSGSGGVLMMGGKQKKYSYYLKLEAAKAALERGMSYSESLRELPSRTKIASVSALSGQFPLAILLEYVALAQSSYYYLLSHPPKPTRPELREAVKESFSRTANGCGHRQIAMALRAESGINMANKTVLKIMHDLGLHCQIRKVGASTKYNAYHGEQKKVFDNILKRDFNANKPWEKLGTDVTAFQLSWGKDYLAPIYNFALLEYLLTPGQIKKTDFGGIPKSVYDIVSIYLAQDYGCSSFFEVGSAEI